MKRNSKILLVMAGIFAVLAIILYSCGGGGGGGGYGSGGTMGSSTVQVVSCSTVTSPVMVSATEYVFNPSPVHAPIGGVVMWTNNGTMTHSVTSGTGGVYSGLFDSTLTPTQSVCLKFTTAGTFNYYCKFHFASFGMAGSVIVP